MELRKMKQRLAEIILEKSFRYREDPPFTLVSGRTSPYYFDCKPTTLNPEGMNLIGLIIFEMLSGADVTAAGGLTLGADPIANALSVISFQRGRPIRSFTVRKDVKDHGTKKAIEGDVKAGERIVVIDDVITTGGSTLTAIERARESGLIVERVIALIDREEGGREAIIGKGGVERVDAILTTTEIMALYREKSAASAV
ncbi:MAG: orotate phosphoribosyltransferase [Syntrophales bacterium LBB04]|nr:orotate phosphoribosyltransferase [Syntrophales bacterium LBB04]